MISMWWLILIVPVSIIIGLSVTAISSANKFADLYEEIVTLREELALKEDYIQKLKGQRRIQRGREKN